MGRHWGGPPSAREPVDPDELRGRGFPPGDRPATARLPMGTEDADGARPGRGAVLRGPGRPVLPTGLPTGIQARLPARSAAPGAALDAGARYRDLDAAGFGHHR